MYIGDEQWVSGLLMRNPHEGVVTAVDGDVIHARFPVFGTVKFQYDQLCKDAPYTPPAVVLAPGLCNSTRISCDASMRIPYNVSKCSPGNTFQRSPGDASARSFGNASQRGHGHASKKCPLNVSHKHPGDASQRVPGNEMQQHPSDISNAVPTMAREVQVTLPNGAGVPLSQALAIQALSMPRPMWF